MGLMSDSFDYTRRMPLQSGEVLRNIGGQAAVTQSHINTTNQGGSDEETTDSSNECGHARTRRATPGERWPRGHARWGAESNSATAAASADLGQAGSDSGGH